ncbi:HNH endonuclease [Bacillus sp. V3B]|uniref:HNH endonuclease n=1 Tax=Bacillus sp. V3B TaxID=2804915 RepID=UPI002108D09A|nr:HNH endonuclease [Bacillus sp. V3B]MCQ6277313.1 HNH endonuclease [Bacillus sp. V3B]
MFIRENEIISLTPQNESEAKLLKYIKRKNGWNMNTQFNDYKINGDGTVTIDLINGLKTTLSYEDYQSINSKITITSLKNLAGGFYAQIAIEGKTMPLHRHIMRHELEKYEGFKEETGLSIVVNHIDEDSLNNTPENLEVVTQGENTLKSHLNHARGFSITPNGKFKTKLSMYKYIGTFDTKEEAREAYVNAVNAELERLEAIRINWLIKNGRIAGVQ